MPFAQAQGVQPGATEVGGWLLCVTAVMATYWLARQIWLSHFPLQRGGDQYVTHNQFNEFRQEVKDDLQAFKDGSHEEFKDFKKEVRDQIRDAAAELSEKVRDLDAYTRDAHHRSATAHQNMIARLAHIQGVMEGKFGAAAKPEAGE